MAINSVDQSQLLAQMRAMAQSVGLESANDTAVTQTQQTSNGFSNLLVRAINQVNETQQESARLANNITTGDGGASLVQAMIASQKSSIAFEATVQVRNKVASAYQEIMNMPI
jgi:flagellar hook-basal body complex protein FliE